MLRWRRRQHWNKAIVELHFAPVLPPSESRCLCLGDDGQIWCHPQNREYVTYCTVVRQGPSHSHLYTADVYGECREVWNAVFSERELTFTSAICCRPSLCRLSVVCRLSVCNVHAPYSAGRNFRQSFYAIWYVGHPLIDIQRKFYGDRPRGGGVKHKRGSKM